MAKYLGLLSTDARGKIGGIVTSRGTVGTIHRRRVAGTQPRTVQQMAARQNLATAQRAFSALAGNVQANWNALAIQTTWTSTLGTQYSPSAQQLYTQCALMLLSAGITTPPTTPTAPPSVPTITINGLSGSSSGILLKYAVPAGFGTIGILCYGSAPQSPGKNSITRSHARILTTLNPANQDIELGPYYKATPPGNGGVLSAGWPLYPSNQNIRIWIRAFDLASGWPGAFASAQTLVTNP